ncbi:hypothetical protein SBRY_100232 [Actinacidiphila bryophytorum]|uniref:Uncharacterized protein n=1 Tax=Actinacidiphila bryophytorum TaxID=1436133 RepID=A0A9W4GYJ6_9ACTN|nr:hypothetical protein SBRY_100232 [Actinacidiphila bryophytorum]
MPRLKRFPDGCVVPHLQATSDRAAGADLLGDGLAAFVGPARPPLCQVLVEVVGHELRIDGLETDLLPLVCPPELELRDRPLGRPAVGGLRQETGVHEAPDWEPDVDEDPDHAGVGNASHGSPEALTEADVAADAVPFVCGHHLGILPRRSMINQSSPGNGLTVREWGQRHGCRLRRESILPGLLLVQLQPEVKRQLLGGVQSLRLCVLAQREGDRDVRVVQRRNHHADADERSGIRQQVGQAGRPDLRRPHPGQTGSRHVDEKDRGPSLCLIDLLLVGQHRQHLRRDILKMTGQFEAVLDDDAGPRSEGAGVEQANAEIQHGSGRPPLLQPGDRRPTLAALHAVDRLLDDGLADGLLDHEWTLGAEEMDDHGGVDLVQRGLQFLLQVFKAVEPARLDLDAQIRTPEDQVRLRAPVAGSEVEGDAGPGELRAGNEFRPHNRDVVVRPGLDEVALRTGEAHRLGLLQGPDHVVERLQDGTAEAGGVIALVRGVEEVAQRMGSGSRSHPGRERREEAGLGHLTSFGNMEIMPQVRSLHGNYSRLLRTCRQSQRILSNPDAPSACANRPPLRALEPEWLLSFRS